MWPFKLASDQGVMTMEADPSGTRASIRYQSAGTVIGFVGGQPNAVYSTVTQPNAWHLWALTYDNITLRLYKDGVQVATSAFVVSTTASVSPRIGEEQGAANPATAFFGEGAFWNSTLSAGQLLSHFNAADTTGTIPLYLGGGTFNVMVGSSGGLSGDLTRLESWVEQTYQNAP